MYDTPEVIPPRISTRLSSFPGRAASVSRSVSVALPVSACRVSAPSSRCLLPGLIFVDMSAWANRPECQLCLLPPMPNALSTWAWGYYNKVSSGMIERCMLLIIVFRRVVRSAGVLGCCGVCIYCSPADRLSSSWKVSRSAARAALSNGLRDASGTLRLEGATRKKG